MKIKIRKGVFETNSSSTQGRLENQEDNRDILCKSCLCDKMGWTKTQYKEKRIEFQDSGCNLF